ncbi:hypothetical protein AVEN_217560-1 [Araneus ventricosus]|uniref:Uncharacterized protein n=1 Tax=Araneus ventricosus TaxID=182803 RepID=A0A4Y2JNI0_ARAVE|nr:hypothetical protein AVEN_217560-1 [Araneus ventricosus]
MGLDFFPASACGMEPELAHIALESQFRFSLLTANDAFYIIEVLWMQIVISVNIAILVCSKLGTICHDKSASLQQVNQSFEVTMERTSSKLAVQTHCKNRVRTQPGIELATYRLVARRRYHSASSTTRGEDRFR